MMLLLQQFTTTALVMNLRIKKMKAKKHPTFTQQPNSNMKEVTFLFLYIRDTGALSYSKY